MLAAGVQSLRADVNPPNGGCNSVGCSIEFQRNGVNIGSTGFVQPGDQIKVLVTINTAVALCQNGVNVPFCFDRGTLTITFPGLNGAPGNVETVTSSLPIVCPGSPRSFTSTTTYSVDPAHIRPGTGGRIFFTMNYGNVNSFPDAGDGFFHSRADDELGAETSCPASLVVRRPCLDVLKECEVPCTPFGQPIRFRGYVTNCSPDEVLTGVTATDDHAGALVLTSDPAGNNPLVPPVTLNPGAVAFYRGQYTPAGQNAQLCGPFMDTVTAQGTGRDTGRLLTDSDDALCFVETRPCLTLEKACAPVTPGCTNLLDGAMRPGVSPGQQFTETFTVRNCGNVPLQDIVIRDTVTDVTGTRTFDIACNPGAILAVGGVCTVTVTRTAPTQEQIGPNSANCVIRDSAVATARNICPANANNPCSNIQTTNSNTATCALPICCAPCIRIVEEVVCVKSGGGCEIFTPEENDQTNACGFRNEDRSMCSAFCFKIKIENRCLNGSPGAATANNIRVTCSDPRVSLASCNFPTSLAPGEMFMCQVGPITLCDDIVNTVCVTADNVPPDSDDTDSVGVQIKPIAVSCLSTFTSSIDMDGLIDNCVKIPSSTTPQPISLKTTISNDSAVDLLVTVSGLPALVECDDQTTPKTYGVIPIPAGQTFDVTGCYMAVCPPDGNFPISVSATVNTNSPNRDCTCYYNVNGIPISTTRNANDNCPVCITCEQPKECRTTGGGQLIPGFVDQSCIPVVTQIFPSTGVKKITHGGQLGAPFSQMDCGTILGNPCIRGQWEHVRHYQGNGNPRDVIDMNFHTVTPKGVFDTLSCACLGCCDPTTGAFIPPVVGPMIHKFALCNPDDHKLCGPQPRPSPANSLIFSGIGRITPEDDVSGPRANRS
jgi:hypothetical protein